MYSYEVNFGTLQVVNQFSTLGLRNPVGRIVDKGKLVSCRCYAGFVCKNPMTGTIEILIGY